MKNLPILLLTLTLLSLYSCDYTTCDLNIDKHEVLMGVNIPKLTDPYHCEKLAGKKISVFQIDMKLLSEEAVHYKSIDEYLEIHEFQKVPTDNTDYLDWLKLFPEDLQSIPVPAELYAKHSQRKNKPWHLLLEKTSGRMWAIIYG